MERKKKVVWKDNDRIKTAVGFVSFNDVFIRVTNESGDDILINKSNVVTIRDGDFNDKNFNNK
jgi:hypothetical protein